MYVVLRLTDEIRKDGNRKCQVHFTDGTQYVSFWIHRLDLEFGLSALQYRVLFEYYSINIHIDNLIKSLPRSGSAGRTRRFLQSLWSKILMEKGGLS